MKQTLRCPKCGLNRILYVARVPDAHDSYQNYGPLFVAQVGGGRGEVAGELEAGVCRACGYTEFYVKDPNAIPVDGRYVREVVGPE